MASQFLGFSPEAFEQFARARALSVFGPGVTMFGNGPDGGCEATFRGAVPYSSSPGNLMVRLRNKANHLIQRYYGKLPLKGHAVWDANQLTGFLTQYEELRRRFIAYLTPGDVLAAMLTDIEWRQPNATRILTAFLERELRADESARLDHAGNLTEEQLRLARLFFGLPVSPEQRLLLVTRSPSRPVSFGPVCYGNCPEMGRGNSILKPSMRRKLPHLIIPRNGFQYATGGISQIKGLDSAACLMTFLICSKPYQWMLKRCREGKPG